MCEIGAGAVAAARHEEIRGEPSVTRERTWLCLLKYQDGNS